MKSIKKFISILIVSALICSLAAPAMAAETDLSLATDKASYEIGETVTVTLSLNADYEVGNLGLRVWYDPDAFEFQLSESTKGTITGFMMSDIVDPELSNYESESHYTEKGMKPVNITGMSFGSNVKAAGAVATLVFTAKAACTEAKFEIGIMQLNTHDNSADYMNTATVSGTAATVNATTPPATAAYTASISADKTEYTVNDTVTVTIDVGGTEGSFASAEVNLKYDANYLTFDPAAQSADIGSISAENGVISIIDHGNDQANNKYTLTFTAKAAVEETKVTLESAAFDKAADAISENLTIAVLNTAEAAMSIKNADFDVELDELMEGTSSVAHGGTYTFTAKDPNYTYELSVNGGSITPAYNEETGKWSIANVTTDLKIEVTKQTAKKFSVAISETDAIEGTPATGENAATYKEDYVFTLKTNVEAGPGTEGYNYSVTKITIGGKEVANSWSADGRVVTIKGEYITGAIEITTAIEELEAGKLSVTLDGEYPEVTADKVSNITKGETVTLTVVPVAGYKYTIKVNGEEKTIAADNKIVIENVNTNLVVDVTRELDLSAANVSVKEYLALNGKTMYIVQVTTKLDDGSVYTYDGANMFWSGKYNSNNGAYAFLVVTANADTALSLEEAIANIDIGAGSAMTIDYSGDVNKSAEGRVDANDAQLVWNMYSAKSYSAIDEATNTTGATMEKFLRADVNGSANVDVNDATAIINIIKNRAN